MLRRSITKWLLLALAVFAIPVSSHAGVFISVGFAPPPLPVYAQPPCPEPGLIWVPGYWAYGDYGYYWVPGAWVPAPYYGALWTPPYWGWDGGFYIFHPGYWGRQVGYYGGVNYGYGYFGIGFVGGMWRGNNFYYNRAVWHIDRGRIRHVYDDDRDWGRHRVVRDSHISYSGGPGGIRYQASPRERQIMRERHMDRTSFQHQHEINARNDRGSYFRNNHGRPSRVVSERPLQMERGNRPSNMRQDRPNAFNNRGNANRQAQRNERQGRPAYQNRQTPQNRQTQRERPNFNQRQQYQPQNRPQGRPSFDGRAQRQSQQQYRPQNNPRFESRPQQQYRPQNNPRSESRPQRQERPSFQGRPQGQPSRESRPAPREQRQERPRGNPHRGR